MQFLDMKISLRFSYPFDEVAFQVNYCTVLCTRCDHLIVTQLDEMKQADSGP
jgi:hypothetical protein